MSNSEGNDVVASGAWAEGVASPLQKVPKRKLVRFVSWLRKEKKMALEPGVQDKGKDELVRYLTGNGF
jgi:hypothetical protein